MPRGTYISAILLTVAAVAAGVRSSPSAPVSATEALPQTEARGPQDPKAKKDDGPAPPPRWTYHPVELTAALNKTKVYPGEKVQLSVTVPTTRKTAAYAVGQRVMVTAEYDPKTERLMNQPREHSYATRADEDFDGLPHDVSVLGDKTLPYTIETDAEKGYKYEFTPRHLGIYLITARWNVRDEPWHVVQSQPVVLVVAPPYDDKGRAQVKKEWVRDSEK